MQMIYVLAAVTGYRSFYTSLFIFVGAIICGIGLLGFTFALAANLLTGKLFALFGTIFIVGLILIHHGF